MQLSLPANTLLLWGLLTGICAAAPAPQDAANGDLPPTCTKFPDGAIVTPSCYTYTLTTTPIKCPSLPCPTQTGPIVCPQLVKVTTISVPCSTDCCPVTPTEYVTNSCPGCGCVIPTATVTVTTGCKVNPGPVVTPTATPVVP
ncbi:hypothetical protein VTK56DRAFT_8419 [Thermocarpiscus australiensis]